ncbi:hypothetical protein CGZ94_00505 [Enemella evansiae]|uniref:HpcH/HpaI aldolase/citrate lyase domain-containing protein n=1 Tax=Enemella evansiae TaxID=2016499 RepID=A0A255GTQ8_9ACTN|nr:hypothetical protein CGZ94_00505 [Enemella evansiae]
MVADANPLLQGLLDDAAVFPPGNKPLEQAVPDHRAHRRSAHRDLVGPLVLPRSALDEIPRLTRGWADGSLEISLTGVPVTEAAAVAEDAITISSIRLAALELVLGDPAPDRLAWRLTELAAVLPGVQLFLEIPRGADGGYDTAVIETLAGTPVMAKLRTGGVTPELYPTDAQLATAIRAAVRSQVPFKATAGLHHAIRNTADSEAGELEQHGFANLLTATGAALTGADDDQVAAALAERDPKRVAAGLAGLDPGVRRSFRSFGTCSIDEPVEELDELGLN